MLQKIALFCLGAGFLMAQNKGNDKDCLTLYNDTKIALLNFDIGDGRCAVTKIEYPTMVNLPNRTVAEGFVYVTVLPSEKDVDGASPKFTVKSGDSRLARLAVSNLRTWGIKPESSEFKVTFYFSMKKRKVYDGSRFSRFAKRTFFVREQETYACSQKPVSPNVSMEVTPTGGILVMIESRVDCIAFSQ